MATEAPVAPRAGRRRISPLAVIFLAPAALLLLGFLLYPIGYSLWRSLFDASGDSFIGLGNYERMFTDSSTFTALKNNVIWVIVAPTVVTMFGLAFAVLTERIRWATVFKTLIFMPMAISFLASGVIFRLVYDEDPNKGVLNAALVAVNDTINPSSGYPGARPSDPEAFDTAGGALTTRSAVAPGGDPVAIGLLAIAPGDLPDTAAAAKEASPGADQIGGTVWLDFTRGGGGEPGVIDAEEKGIPDVEVEAVRDGEVVATTTTGDDGVFTFDGLASGDYQLRLAASTFHEPFNGVTWLGPTLVTWSIIGAYVWIYAGFAMVLLAAGMSAIPRDALEAARIDGATEWQVFRKVTMPLLSPVIVVVFVTLVINVLKLFDLVFIIAPGSVQPDANVLALQMWRVAFGGGQDHGLGSAISIVLLLLVVPAMIFNVRRFRRDDS